MNAGELRWKKIKLPRKRKKRYIKDNSQSDYKLSIIAAEVCMEQDDKQRGFPFHSKFLKRFGTGINRFKVIENY